MHVYDQETGTLIVYVARIVEDTAKYICLAKNSEATAVGSAFVSVRKATLVKKRPENAIFQVCLIFNNFHILNISANYMLNRIDFGKSKKEYIILRLQKTCKIWKRQINSYISMLYNTYIRIPIYDIKDLLIIFSRREPMSFLIVE